MGPKSNGRLGSNELVLHNLQKFSISAVFTFSKSLMCGSNIHELAETVRGAKLDVHRVSLYVRSECEAITVNVKRI